MDGRFFPWGDDFDPSWCHMKDSHRGRKVPAEVGSYPVDESVYGVRDLAGNMRDWTATAHQADGDVGDGEHLVAGQGAGEAGSARVARGGCWNIGASLTRVADRSYLDPGGRFSFLGFRLSRTIP